MQPRYIGGNMKHSKGSWRAIDSQVICIYEEKDFDGQVIDNEAEVLIANCGVSHLTTGTTEANARLIAAAPELLKEAKIVLKKIESCIESQLNDWITESPERAEILLKDSLKELEARRSAINKAEGR